MRTLVIASSISGVHMPQALLPWQRLIGMGLIQTMLGLRWKLCKAQVQTRVFTQISLHPEPSTP